MKTNLHYEFGNVEALKEAKSKLEVSNSSPIEPHKNDYHNSLMILGLTLSVACALVLTLYNPLTVFSTSTGLGEIITEIVAFKPF